MTDCTRDLAIGYRQTYILTSPSNECTMSESTLTMDEPELVSRVKHLDCVDRIEHIKREDDDTGVLDTVILRVSDTQPNDLILSPILLDKITDSYYELSSVSERGNDYAHDYVLYCHRR